MGGTKTENHFWDVVVVVFVNIKIGTIVKYLMLQNFNVYYNNYLVQLFNNAVIEHNNKLLYNVSSTYTVSISKRIQKQLF